MINCPPTRVNEPISLVCRGLTVVIIALWCMLCNNGQVLMRSSRSFYVTEQREWQPEREQMEILVTQASNACMQSEKSCDEHEWRCWPGVVPGVCVRVFLDLGQPLCDATVYLLEILCAWYCSQMRDHHKCKRDLACRLNRAPSCAPALHTVQILKQGLPESWQHRSLRVCKNQVVETLLNLLNGILLSVLVQSGKKTKNLKFVLSLKQAKVSSWSFDRR